MIRAFPDKTLSGALQRALLLSAGILLIAGYVVGQGPTSGSISGVVADPSGAAVASAKVSVTSPSLVVAQSTLTTAQGTYRFPSLPPGTYELIAEAPGFSNSKRENIVINVGFSASIDVALSIAGQAQTVAVTSEAPVLDTENTKLQETFTTEALANLPTARDMWSLIGVAAGLQLNRFDVGGSTTGTQTSFSSYGYQGQQRVQMDGVNMTEGSNAVSAYTDYSAFQEVQMGTSGNDATMPSPGVQINFVVKSGGNQLHGDFYQDYENHKFQGTNISTEQFNRGAGIGTRITGYHDSNGDLGGPLRKDKLWFFTSFRRQYIGTTITGYPVENPGSGPPFSTILSNGTYKLTYQINSNNKISHMLNFERKQQPFRNAASNQYSDAVYKQDLIEWIGNLEWSSTLSPNAFLNVRVGSWGYNWGNAAYPGPGGSIEDRRVDNTSGDTAGGYNPQRYSRRRFQIEPTLSYSRTLLGLNNFFTIGFLTEKETYNFEQYPYKDAIQLTFASPSGAPDFTTPSQVTIFNTPAITWDYLRHSGAYVQDKIKISKKLTLNLGVRWDYYNNYRPDETVRSDVKYAAFFLAGAPLPNGYSIPASFPDYKIPGNDSMARFPLAFAPRVGLAYDLFGNGKTTVKISYGRYYKNTSTDISMAVNPIRQLSYTFKWNDLNADRQFQSNEFGAFQSSTGSATSPIGANLKQTYLDDYSGFVEHEISTGFVLRGGFVYRKLAHDFARVELLRLGSLYTNPVTITDSGPLGATPAPITVYDIPASSPLPSSLQEWQSPDSNNSYYRNIEFSANRRMTAKWTMNGSYLATWSTAPLNSSTTSSTASGTVIPTQPNIAQYNQTRTFDSNFRAFGTYRAPFGLVVSPIFRFQLGTQLGRYLTVGGLRVGSLTIPVEPVGAYRQDNIAIFDTRIEKQLLFRERYRIGIFFDAFNINNSNAAQNQDNITGTKTITINNQKVTYQRFLAPTTVISPRIFRLGVKFSF